VKPEDHRPERSSDPAPDDTAAHPAEAGSLWEMFLSRGNLAEALRRVERNAGAPGIDEMSTKELRPWLHDHWPQVRSELDAGTYRPLPVPGFDSSGLTRSPDYAFFQGVTLGPGVRSCA
jgi:RNA-directed DNA polymerase